MTDPLRAVDPTRLARFLRQQRWFAAGDVSSVELRAVAPLPEADAVLACARALVAGEPVDYQVPLALRDGDEADRGAVARAGERLVVDALADPACLRRIARAFAGAESFAADDARWTFTALAELPELGPPRPLSGEQSNTSVVLGERAILKFYRRLAPGEHPDVEVARALLTRTPFRGTPALLGVAHLVEGTASSVAAALYEYVPDAVDGWTHVLARLRAGEDPSPDLTILGAVTRELHAALAGLADDPAFAPEPTADADLARWQAAAVEAVQRSMARLRERRADLPPALGATIQRVLAHPDELAARARLDHPAGAYGPKIRHHGDYHLGQTLRTAGGWRILDFEGEPTRPLAERRRKHHPLRDVAGMLRSFAYAAAVAGIPAAEARMRAAFLAGYDPTLLDEPPRADLLALFTAEKLFYELDYELGHRPDWVWIPLQAIAALLPPEPARAS